MSSDITAALAAAAGFIEQTSLFATVKVGRGNQGPTLGFDQPQDPKTPSAWLKPISWRVVNAAGGLDGEETVRLTSFEITITGRDEAGSDLQDLAEACMNAIQGQSLVGSLAWLTRLEEGRWVESKASPANQLVLGGQFAHLYVSTLPAGAAALFPASYFPASYFGGVGWPQGPQPPQGP